MKLPIRLLVFMGTIFLIACGGGDGNSSNDNTSNEISIEAAEELAVAAKETSAQIMASESDVALPPLSGVSSTVSNTLKSALIASPEKQVASFAESLGPLKPYAEQIGTDSKAGECGGTADSSWVITSSDDGGYPITMDYDYALNDYCLDSNDRYSVIYNGIFTMDMNASDKDNATFEYLFDIDYTTDIPGISSGSLYYAQSCTITKGVRRCSTGVYESAKTTYHTSDVSITGDSTSGYNVDYTITDSEGNSCSVAFTGLTLCENGNVGSGTGTITINGEVIHIEFVSCDQYIVTYDGNSETYSQ